MNMNLEVEVLEKEDTVFVNLTGEIDAYTAPKLKESLVPLTKHSNHTIVVNMEKVSYMDSTGLGVFISALKSTKENHSTLKLVHLQDRVERLFAITGLDSVITIDTTIRGGNE